MHLSVSRRTIRPLPLGLTLRALIVQYETHIDVFRAARQNVVYAVLITRAVIYRWWLDTA